MRPLCGFGWNGRIGSRAGQWCRRTRGGEPCRHSRHKYTADTAVVSQPQVEGGSKSHARIGGESADTAKVLKAFNRADMAADGRAPSAPRRVFGSGNWPIESSLGGTALDSPRNTFDEQRRQSFDDGYVDGLGDG